MKTCPLSLLSRNGFGTRPSVPKRAISTCSNALEAVLAVPLRDRCHRSSSRVWGGRSLAPASPNRHAPPDAYISVDHRWFGDVATDGMAWIRARKPIACLRTCQPFGRRICCKVFLLNPSRCATVRYPNDADSSISALIDSASRGLHLPLRLDRTVVVGVHNHC